MKHIPPFNLRTSRTLNPKEVYAGLEYARRERDDVNDQKWGYDEIVIPFDDMQTADDPEEGRMYFTPPATTGRWEVFGIEIAAENASGSSEVQTANLVRVSDSAVLASVSVTLNQSAVTISGQGPASAVLEPSTEYYVELVQSGQWGTVALTRCTVTLHVRFDQLEGQPPATYVGVAWGQAADGSSVAAAVAAFQADVDARVAKVRKMSCTVFTLRNATVPIAANLGTRYIEANGRVCLGASIGVIGHASKTYTFSLDADGLGAVSENLEATGVTSTARSSIANTDTQNNDPHTPASDGTFVFVEGTATNPAVRAYAFVWWER